MSENALKLLRKGTKNENACARPTRALHVSRFCHSKHRICASHPRLCTPCACIWQLKRATDGNRKRAVFLFNLSSPLYLYLVSFQWERRSLAWESGRDHCPGVRNAQFQFQSVAAKDRLLKFPIFNSSPRTQHVLCNLFVSVGHARAFLMFLFFFLHAPHVSLTSFLCTPPTCINVLSLCTCPLLMRAHL